MLPLPLALYPMTIELIFDADANVVNEPIITLFFPVDTSSPASLPNIQLY